MNHLLIALTLSCSDKPPENLVPEEATQHECDNFQFTDKLVKILGNAQDPYTGESSDFNPDGLVTHWADVILGESENGDIDLYQEIPGMAGEITSLGLQWNQQTNSPDSIEARIWQSNNDERTLSSLALENGHLCYYIAKPEYRHEEIWHFDDMPIRPLNPNQGTQGFYLDEIDQAHHITFVYEINDILVNGIIAGTCNVSPVYDINGSYAYNEDSNEIIPYEDTVLQVSDYNGGSCEAWIVKNASYDPKKTLEDYASDSDVFAHLNAYYSHHTFQ
ncbi:MAG: hypothetical protein WC897_02460 [Candidatus Gracilibacteria bacterium]